VGRQADYELDGKCGLCKFYKVMSTHKPLACMQAGSQTITPQGLLG